MVCVEIGIGVERADPGMEFMWACGSVRDGRVETGVGWWASGASAVCTAVALAASPAHCRDDLQATGRANGRGRVVGVSACN